MKNHKKEIVREIMMGSLVALSSDATDHPSNVISLGHIRHIPVVKAGKLVGLISERDLSAPPPTGSSGTNREANRR